MIKVPKRLGKEEPYLHIVKILCGEPIGNIILNEEN
jgi:hypothetical protein